MTVKEYCIEYHGTAYVWADSEEEAREEWMEQEDNWGEVYVDSVSE